VAGTAGCGARERCGDAFDRGGAMVEERSGPAGRPPQQRVLGHAAQVREVASEESAGRQVEPLEHRLSLFIGIDAIHHHPDRHRRTFEMMAEPTLDGIAALIEINRNIAAGLSTTAPAADVRAA
jgi:hypothetical protein